MSSLYRCRARVAYRPAGSEQLILFDEKQIQELNVRLKWQPNAAFANADRSTEASIATNGLGQSTCSVTISDPYLTGVAWPTLFDLARLYTQTNISAANNILLPPCSKGQDPYIDKCVEYIDTESDNTTDSGGKFPFLLLSLWYDVKGTSFGTDFYFRVNGFSISHGTKYPSVTIRGVEVRSVLFNQSLVNIALDEGVDIDKALKDLAESMGFSVSFCTNTNTDPTKKRILPRSVRYTGITTDEAIKKVLNSVNGNSLSMPTREYANKISMCSRGEVNQGCSVFYLGRGLYEGYEISGQPELTAQALNAEFGSNVNNADPYVSEAFKSSSYFIGDVAPKTRKKAMEKVKKPAFPKIFEAVPKHIKGAHTATGYVWRGKGPDVINEEATKIQENGLNLFGIAPNGMVAISFLAGEVIEANEKDGRVDIKTTFSFHVCEKRGSEKCFYRPIHQESTGLSSVKVKAKDKLTISQEIGTSTAEKPEFVRFYILGHNGAYVTLDPQLVWDWAFSSEELPKTQIPAIAGPGNNVVPPASKSALKDWSATTTANAAKILIMAGHADLISSGAANEASFNIELVKWAQRNVAAYGISDIVEFYLPSSGNIPESDPRSQYSKTSAGVSEGKQVIEIHNDQTAGKSGVIPPRGNNRRYPLDDNLASSYGAFSVNHRDGLGVPNRGGTILEVGRMDGAVQRVIESGSPAQKEALYKQLMDPLMRSIAAKKSGNASSPASASASNSATSQFIGRVGSTGRSTAAHVHFQFSGGNSVGSEAKLTDIANKYFLIGNSPMGKVDRNQGYGAGRNHQGIDFGFEKGGQPVYVTNGASIKQVVETKCTEQDNRYSTCGGGFGNHVKVSTPDGEVILAHFAPESIPPNIAGLTTSSGGGKNNPTIQGSPTANGLNVETSFKGVPRALRIIPGRTILSFVTDYDTWVEGGRPATTDPGVWIAGRFKSWFVNECDYKWRDGDLRVQIEGVSAWGSTTITVPTFDDYLKGLKGAGDIKITSTYYDYIRSLGGLSWKMEDGKDSTEVNCPEAQLLSAVLSQQSDPGNPSPTDVNGSFPESGCKTGDPNKDAIINGLYSAGLKTKNALAGVLGNMTRESGLNSNIHNSSRPGQGCGNTPSRILGTTGYGLVQWCGPRADELATKYSCGRNCSLTQQLSFLQHEFGRDYKTMIGELNNAKSAGDAANIFMRKFEVPGDPNGEEPGRRKLGEEIVKQIKCDKPA